MERPHNIPDIAPEIRLYIEHLEQKIADTEEDGVRGFIIVINRKINQIKRSIDSYDFKIESTDDKAYERFWAACLQINKLAKDMEDMMVRYNIKEEDIKEKPEKKKPPMERMVLNQDKGKRER